MPYRRHCSSDTPLSTEAQQALDNYERTLAQTQRASERSAEAARQKLLTDLEIAQERAARANLLDQALAIRALRHDYESKVRFAPRAEPLQIVSAFYGQNISWLDVTERVRRAVRGKTQWTTTVTTEALGDPAPGFNGPRTLIVHYQCGKKLLFKAAYEGNELILP